jgi:hypothetical protein
MNTNADFDRHAAAYLADGPTELSGRVLDAALREVHETRQRGRWSAPWRSQPMFSAARLAAVAAVALLAFGFALVGVSGPNPTPSPSTIASAGPSTGCLVAPANGQLLASDCTYSVEVLGMATTIRGTGSFQFSAEPERLVLQGIDSSSGYGSIEIIPVRSLPISPCAEDGIGLANSAPTNINTYLDWFRTGPITVANTDVTVGGIAGQRIRLATLPQPTPADETPECFFVWLAGGDITGLALLGASDGPMDINILAANGAVFLVVAHYPGSQPHDLAGVLAQIDGFHFEP